MLTMDFLNDTLGMISVWSAYLLLVSFSFLPYEMSERKGALFLTSGLGVYLFAGCLNAMSGFFTELGISEEIFVFTRFTVSLAATLFMLAAATQIWRRELPEQEFVLISASFLLVVAWLEIFVYHDLEVLTWFENMLPALGLLFVVASFALKRAFSYASFFTALVLGGFCLLIVLHGIYGFYMFSLLSIFFVLVALSYMFLRVSALKNKTLQNEDILRRTLFQAENLPLPVLMASAKNGSFLIANSAAERLFNISTGELPRYHLQDIFADPKLYEEVFQKLQNHKHFQFEFLGKAFGESSAFWLSASVDEVFYQGQKTYYILFEEMLVRKKIEEMNARRKYQDLLTGTWTSASFEKKVSTRLQELQKRKEKYALLVLDINDFKNLNVQFGVQTADEILIETASVLQALAEPQDMIIGRVGADAFAVFLLADALEAQAFANRILARIEKAEVPSSKGVFVHFSVAIGGVVSAKDSYQVLFQKAYEALSRAQNIGAGKVVFYKPSFALKHALPRVKKQIHPLLLEEKIEEISLLDEPSLTNLPEE